MFPGRTDAALLGDVEQVFGSRDDDLWELVQRDPVDERFAVGIHGTPHPAGNCCAPEHLPDRRESGVLPPPGRGVRSAARPDG